jgi:hypothetical protein
MLAFDFSERVAQRFQEILVGGHDRAVHVEFDGGLRFVESLELRLELVGSCKHHGDAARLPYAARQFGRRAPAMRCPPSGMRLGGIADAFHRMELRLIKNYIKVMRNND